MPIKHTEQIRFMLPSSPPETPLLSHLGSASLRGMAILIGLVLTAAGGRAQSLSVDWFGFSSGAGTCTGGVFSVSGGIGQATTDPRTATGGRFSMQGGFWSIFAVQTPGAPLLSITKDPQLPVVTIAWPSPSTGFILQQISELNKTNWVNVPQSVNDNGTTRSIVVTNPAGENRFYRLFKP
jgi:hypothetical protein